MSLWNFLGKDSFYMRDFKNAYRLRPDISPPRQKFQGYVNFIFNRSLLYELYGDPTTKNEFRTTIGSLVRTADLPGVNFRTETLNEYNRKRIVNTGVEYEPVNITVFDTVGNEWLTTIMKYFAYHYMDPRNEFTQGDRDPNSQSLDYLTSGIETINSRFGSESFDSNRAGYNPNFTAHFFERIDYVLYHKNKGIQYSLFNPTMTSFKPSGIDYSDSGVMEFNMSFEYEKFTTYNVYNFNLSREDLDRFEDVSELEGPAFLGDNAAGLSMGEQNLEILGGINTGAQAGNRARTPQPVKTRTDDFAQELRTQESDRVRTYGEPVTFAPGSPLGIGGQIVNGIGTVIDRGLTEAINGGDVQDAVVSGVISVGSSILGGAINGVISPESPNQPNEIVSQETQDSQTQDALDLQEQVQQDIQDNNGG